jgi:UDP-2,4-diacetamido-2,4,6-trideoxy-beta-L-altropyranose hydrolase
MAPAWLFRVASASEVGGGHVARCRALACELARSQPVTMMLDRDGLFWRDSLEANGLAVLSEDDAARGPWAGSLLDGYRFSLEEARRLKDMAPPLVVIDDFVSPPAFADLVVCPGGSVGPGRAEQLPMPVLAGPEYALLASEFSAEPAIETRAEARDVLVTFGRRDGGNATCLVLDALELAAADGWMPSITVILGGTAPHLEAVRQKIAKLGDRAHLLTDVDDMADRLRACDLAIGAGGVSLFERMACGVPSVTVLTADNQEAGATEVARRGATLLAGARDELSPEGLSDNLKQLSRNANMRAAMAEAARRTVDGRGAERVARRMVKISRQSNQHSKSLSSHESKHGKSESQNGS